MTMNHAQGAARAGFRAGIGTAMIATLTAFAAAQDYPQDSPAAAALAKADAAVQAIIAVPDGQRSFENTIGALDDLVTRLQTETNLPAFMAQVSTDAAE